MMSYNYTTKHFLKGIYIYIYIHLHAETRYEEDIFNNIFSLRQTVSSSKGREGGGGSLPLSLSHHHPCFTLKKCFSSSCDLRTSPEITNGLLLAWVGKKTL